MPEHTTSHMAAPSWFIASSDLSTVGEQRSQGNRPAEPQPRTPFEPMVLDHDADAALRDDLTQVMLTSARRDAAEPAAERSDMNGASGAAPTLRITRTQPGLLADRVVTSFIVEVRQLGFTWEVARRYSDFDQLHELLSFQWSELPPLPPKLLFTQEASDDASRMLELDVYLRSLVGVPGVAESPLLGTFLDAAGPQHLRVLEPSTPREESPLPLLSK